MRCSSAVPVAGSDVSVARLCAQAPSDRALIESTATVVTELVSGRGDFRRNDRDMRDCLRARDDVPEAAPAGEQNPGVTAGECTRIYAFLTLESAITYSACRLPWTPPR